MIYTNYEWDFTNDGTFDATGANDIAHLHRPTEPTTSALTVTDNTGATNTLVKKGYIVISNMICHGARLRQHQPQQGAEDLVRCWLHDGRSNSSPGNYNKIIFQSINGGVIDPQPGGCDAVITVGP